MKRNLLLPIILTILISCANSTEPPAPYGPLPTKAQLEWHKMEYFSLVCYGLNTFTEEEWAYGDVDPGLFNPSDLNTDQWAKVTSESGMKGLILVAKHHDGFCLWPSKYTDYSVKATTWKNGQGDVLGDLAQSCKKYGLKLGVYLSPWDRNHAEYGRPEYVQYFYNQLEELLTNYGDIFEFWIDGANGGTGYYGGAREKRSIDRTKYYGYETIFSIVKKHHPNALIFSDVGPGCRWVGNESGIGGETNWNTISTNGKYPGTPDPKYHKKLQQGEEGGSIWIPAEVNTTLLWPKAWYHKTGHQSRSLQNLMELYYTSVGRGSPLNLGIAIAPTGKISEQDTKTLLSFRQQLLREFETNLIKNSKLTTSNKRGGPRFKATNCKDEDSQTYWATEDGVNEASIEIDLGKKTEFNRLRLEEFIALGQRINSFSLEAETNGKNQLICEGTTVGYKRLLKFEPVIAQKLRLKLKTNAPCVTLSEIGLYNAPKLVLEPVPNVDTKGNLEFISGGNVVYYATTKDPEKKDYNLYTTTVSMPKGGTIHFYAIDKSTGFTTEIRKEQISMARNNWRVLSKHANADCIDNRPKTFTEIHAEKNSQPELVIDLKNLTAFNAFAYLPRQDGKKKGTVYEYELQISQDNKQWETISSGTLSNIENNPNRRIINLNDTHKAKYIKLKAISGIRNTNTIAVAELELLNI